MCNIAAGPLDWFLSESVPHLIKVLVLHDVWESSDYVTAEEVLKNADLTWLCGFISYDEGVIGPLVYLGTPGCSQCADKRLRMAGGNQNNILENLLYAQDKELQLMVDRLQMVAGYDVFLFNMTMETGIPSIWATVKNNKTTGANLICAAGAHLDPIRAAKSVLTSR